MNNEEVISTLHTHRNDSPDSIEIGTPAKGGAIKCYGDFNDTESFKAKIDAAFAVRKYAQSKMEETQ